VTQQRLLLVDDNDDVREMYETGLETHGFEVVTASNVNDALRLIANDNFDVLLSDMNMPDAGDGFTVVSAMRHTHPRALTLLVSGFPAVEEAMSAILKEADHVLAKPVGIAEITEIIQKNFTNPGAHSSMKKESVATILERDLEATIRHWMIEVEQDSELMLVKLSYQDRTGHLPKLLRDLLVRMRLAANVKVPLSKAAREHGILRNMQG
jgi:DNA-binding NtrC family response regulator